MKRFLLIAGGLVILAVAAIAIVPFFVPKEVYKARIEETATNTLQRNIVLAGDVGLSIFPRIAARIEDVSIANAEGFEGEHMVRAGALRASVKWAPLLSGKIEVEEIAFIDAEVLLQRNSEGAVNWAFGEAEEQAEAAPESEGGGAPAIDAGIGRARLVNASLVYDDAEAGTRYELQDFNVEASVASLSEPLKAKGEGLFDGLGFAFDMTLSTPNAVLSNETASIKAGLKTDLGDASYDGTFKLGEVIEAAGHFAAELDNAKAALDRFEVEVQGGELLEAVAVEGDIAGTLENLQVTNLDFRHDGGAFEATYKGAAALVGAAQSVDGTFTFSTPDAGGLANAFGIEVTGATLAKAVTASGEVRGTVDNLRASNLDLKHSGEAFNATYQGAFRLEGEAQSVDGRFTFDAADVGALAKALEIEVAGADALKKVRASGAVTGPVTGLSVTNLDAAHQSSLLAASYKGAVSLAGDGRVDGQITASSDQLRRLLEIAEVALTPGETLQSFSFDGAAKGTFKRIDVSDLTFALDDIRATGSAGADLSRARPLVTADMQMGDLDLTAFMGEPAKTDPNAPAPPAGWSKAPLDLTSLKAADANIKLSVTSLKIDKVKMTDADLTATLTNGDLQTSLGRFNMFGGAWNGDLALKTSGATPTLSMEFNGDSILFQDLMRTFTGTDRVTGGGLFAFNGTSRGGSLFDIVNNLNGELRTDLADGAIKGVNLSQLLRSKDSLAQSLASGNFALGLSPEAETDFSSLNTLLTIRNGVADIDVMQLLSPLIAVEGLGKINLGGQSIDMTMNISADKTAQGNLSQVQLNGIGIPLRITGNWLSPRIAPDTKALANALTSGAVSQLTGNLGGQLDNALGEGAGGIISGLFGNGQSPRPAPAAPAEPALSDTDEADDEPEEEEEPVRPEDLARDAARRALGGLFKRD